ncbi:MAG: hypothetical protein AVDCRST_MAG51-981 [uncultured Ramlibacter sp.]|uniref:Uncharacterized protein n=1 Tax=uncultured Ramlibacter sp. TaxID=260755 RepID=A0A6J4P7C2_9BURK|nr:MAG: hypothetical protein AVDCRST_MAG51-981 [uncultured Ramlibacter sp.]
MGFMSRLFGGSAPQPADRKAVPSRSPHASAAHAASTRGASNSPQSVRKELVRVVTRDTLQNNGVPVDWIKVEPLTTAQQGRETGVHVRLCVQQWDPRLMIHAVALQQNLEKRIHALDPLAEQWLMGISWQFALKDQSQCPPLPHPGSWTAPPPEVSAVIGQVAASEGNADVISGPTRIGGGQTSDARKDLEKLLGERDADFQTSQAGGFQKTQPVKL